MSLSSLRSPARVMITAFLLSLASSHAQQTYVGRYDAFGGFADIDSPALGLNEQGFNAQFGLNTNRWLAFGGDYSIATGSEVLTTGLLTPQVQAAIASAQVGFILEGAIPANYSLHLPTNANTQTFGLGPQVEYRHFTRATLFIHPSLGALREHVVPKPVDTFQQFLVAQLAPATYKTDWTGTYGVGGGGEFNVTQHFSLRAGMELVWNHPFNDILENGRWTFRYSVGPSFQFGRNALHGGH